VQFLQGAAGPESDPRIRAVDRAEGGEILGEQVLGTADGAKDNLIVNGSAEVDGCAEPLRQSWSRHGWAGQAGLSGGAKVLRTSSGAGLHQRQL
jgi:hypothetical protein